MHMDRRTPHVSLEQRRILFCEQLRKAWLIIAIGVLLLVSGVFVILNNERQTARQIVSLDEARANVRSIKMDESSSNQANRQLLHIAARLYTDEPLTEPDYNIQVQAAKLKRRVQMYQWICYCGNSVCKMIPK